MKILLTNDDGIDAPGIAALAERLRKLGEVLVVAPEREMSGTGHAFTKRYPLRVRRHFALSSKDKKLSGYATTGTPADSVKLGLFLAEGEIDWVISGMNTGGNLGVDLFYSGTVSGAIEGAIDGYPAIAFSLTSQNELYPGEYKYGVAAEIAADMLRELLEKDLPLRTCLNVNIPNLEREEIKGIEITEQACQRYADYFDVREDPFGEKYYWLTGKLIGEDRQRRSDFELIKEGVITVTPIRVDLTDLKLLEELKRWNLKAVRGTLKR